MLKGQKLQNMQSLYPLDEKLCGDCWHKLVFNSGKELTKFLLTLSGCREQSEFKRAEEVLKQALEIEKTVHNESTLCDGCLVMLLNNLAATYRYFGDYQQAEKYVLDALNYSNFCDI